MSDLNLEVDREYLITAVKHGFSRRGKFTHRQEIQRGAMGEVKSYTYHFEPTDGDEKISCRENDYGIEWTVQPTVATAANS